MLRSYIEAIENLGWIFFPEVVSFVKEGGSIVSCNGSGLLAHYNWSIEPMWICIMRHKFPCTCFAREIGKRVV